MQAMDHIKTRIATEGFAIIEDVYEEAEVEKMLSELSVVDTSRTTFRKTMDLFAIRQFLKEVPSLAAIIMNKRLKAIISSILGDDYFIVKSIYFDKPGQSNWFVAYHQDLTISVDKKIDLEGYGLWTTKQNQFAVQPPLHILQKNFTIRIHLDDTDEKNGALKVIPGSHIKGIYKRENTGEQAENEVVCDVRNGGIMIMEPLLLHASGRTTNHSRRRVLHLEFSNQLLEGTLKWSEFMDIKK